MRGRPFNDDETREHRINIFSQSPSSELRSLLSNYYRTRIPSYLRYLFIRIRCNTTRTDVVHRHLVFPVLRVSSSDTKITETLVVPYSSLSVPFNIYPKPSRYLSTYPHTPLRHPTRLIPWRKRSRNIPELSRIVSISRWFPRIADQWPFLPCRISLIKCTRDDRIDYLTIRLNKADQILRWNKEYRIRVSYLHR